MIYRFIGTDKTGIPRVFALSESKEEAMKDCKSYAAEYVAKRPESGPLSKWDFMRSLKES